MNKEEPDRVAGRFFSLIIPFSCSVGTFNPALKSGNSNETPSQLALNTRRSKINLNGLPGTRSIPDGKLQAYHVHLSMFRDSLSGGR
jgi:hypothetical protein